LQASAPNAQSRGRRHPVHIAGLDGLHAAERIAMVDNAFEQVSHGRQSNVRVWSNVETVAGRQFGRPHMIEENERPHGTAGGGRQQALDAKAAKVLNVGLQHLEGSGHGDSCTKSLFKSWSVPD
jgi:hypothetical protein